MKAAGVLITENGKILGFFRRGIRNPGYGLPCGSVNRGETFESAAIRETLEETGLVVKLLPNPYIDRDVKGRAKVLVFRAEPVGGRLDAPSLREGYPEWVTPEQLLSGPFGPFSGEMLRHFGLLPITLEVGQDDSSIQGQERRPRAGD